MTKRAGKTYPPDPHQWYREPRSSAVQAFRSLAHLFGPSGSIVWDCCTGSGNLLDVARENGFQTFGSDIVDRGAAARHQFLLGDFLQMRALPFRPPFGARVSIVCNPPYGRVGGVANMGEKFVQHALGKFGSVVDAMAFILPIEFIASVGRYWKIYEKRPPSAFAVFCERPSMPPGAMVEELGEAAFSGGMADYCVLVWSRHYAGSDLLFIRPDNSSRPPDLERRVR